MSTFILYGTPACHLCEIAEDMLEAELAGRADRTVQPVDISDSDELFGRYGLTIPVLRHPDGRELNWPFTREQLRAFLGSS